MDSLGRVYSTLYPEYDLLCFGHAICSTSIFKYLLHIIPMGYGSGDMDSKTRRDLKMKFEKVILEHFENDRKKMLQMNEQKKKMLMKKLREAIS